jgi:hypothetical protein
VFWTISSILTLSLSIQVPLSTLSGRVMDERNTAVGKIAVQLLRKLYEPDGRAGFQIIQTTITNAEGVYRFASLGADRYYVRTSALISATSRNPNTSSPPPQAYASTYYPATTNEILALPVEVTADSCSKHRYSCFALKAGEHTRPNDGWDTVAPTLSVLGVPRVGAGQ